MHFDDLLWSPENIVALSHRKEKLLAASPEILDSLGVSLIEYPWTYLNCSIYTFGARKSFMQKSKVSSGLLRT